MDDRSGDDPMETFDDDGFMPAPVTRDPASPERRTAEGVRIIGAEEAAAAIESGHIAGRQPDDAPRFGDVPDAPQGPRPPLRFPLSDADPATLPKPPVAGPDAGRAPPRGGAAPPVAGSGDTLPGGVLPHWTEPPSGEVPQILSDADRPAPDDDLAVWSSVSSTPRWRDQPNDWEAGDFDEEFLQDSQGRLGALDDDRPGDDFFDRPETTAPPPSTTRMRSARPPAPPRLDATREAPTERDIPARVASGVFVAGMVLAAAALGPAALLVVVTAAVVTAAGELYHALHSRGYHPATLLGLVATASLMGAAYWRGQQAFPLVLALFMIFCLLWYLAGVVRAQPVMNIGVSVLAFLYVGFLGSFAALLLRFPRHDGVRFIIGAIIATAANDIGAFFTGRAAGKTPLAPELSPNKTWEGLVGASFATLLACLAIVQFIRPWSIGRAFWLAVVVVVVAPLGDLCQSMIKRDLDVKDMGSILPGHGGVLDRIDALLFVIPATYYLVRLLDVA